VFERGNACGYPKNPWNVAAGVPLAKFLATPMERYRLAVGRCVDKAVALDQTASPLIPPFDGGEDVLAAAAARAELADRVQAIAAKFDPAALARWAAVGETAVAQETSRLKGLAPQVELIAQGPADPELAAAYPTYPALTSVNLNLTALEAYLPSAASFLGFLAFGKKKAAAAVLAPLGLQLSPDNAKRARDFLLRLKARILVQQAVDHLIGVPAPGITGPRPDDELLAATAKHIELFDLLLALMGNAQLKSVDAPVRKHLATTQDVGPLVQGLKGSTGRAAAIAELESSVATAELFSAAWLRQIGEHARRGAVTIGPHVRSLNEALPTLEHVLRIRETLATRPKPLREATVALLKQAVAAEDGLAILTRRPWRWRSRGGWSPTRGCRPRTARNCAAPSPVTQPWTPRSATPPAPQSCTAGQRGRRRGCWRQPAVASTARARTCVAASPCGASAPCVCGR
jgi:hypothetical protein